VFLLGATQIPACRNCHLSLGEPFVYVTLVDVSCGGRETKTGLWKRLQVNLYPANVDFWASSK